MTTQAAIICAALAGYVLGYIAGRIRSAFLLRQPRDERGRFVKATAR